MSSVGRSTSASVNISVISVAMSGSIMPTPLATPTTMASLPATAALRDLGDGVGGHDAAGHGDARRGRRTAGHGLRCPARTRSIGYWRPITPVDAMSTSSASQPSAAATPATTSRALARPCVAGGDVGVLGDHHDGACRAIGDVLAADDDARPGEAAAGEHARPPGNGRSAATTTKSSVSSLMPMLATWQLKPRGRVGEAGIGCVRVTVRQAGRLRRWRRLVVARPRPAPTARKMSPSASICSAVSRSMRWRRTLATWSPAAVLIASSPRR